MRGAAIVLAGAGATAAAGPAPQLRPVAGGVLETPSASQERAENRGRAAHANVHVFHPAAPPPGAAFAGAFETPASLACLYGLTLPVAGCNPLRLTRVATGGSRMVAVVDAYDDPSAAADLATYSARFGLPPITPANFTVVYAAGTRPAQDSSGGWSLEAALDIEMVHALAPGARIVLVEAATNNFNDLFAAEQKAAGLVAAAGGGEVSNSWSGAEFPGEQGYVPAFTGRNVVFFASAGDSSGTGVPAVLPNVIAVGGTTVNRDAAGNFIGQTTWPESGGGVSLFVSAPAFQQAVTPVVGRMRGTPDIALVANPNSGVWIYDSTPYNGSPPGWMVVGGTSLASPASAAIVNNAGAFRPSTAAELRVIYANIGRPRNFTDIVTGACPNAPGGTASVGYDLCTGVGTPLGRAGK